MSKKVKFRKTRNGQLLKDIEERLSNLKKELKKHNRKGNITPSESESLTIAIKTLTQSLSNLEVGPHATGDNN